MAMLVASRGDQTCCCPPPVRHLQGACCQCTGCGELEVVSKVPLRNRHAYHLLLLVVPRRHSSRKVRKRRCHRFCLVAADSSIMAAYITRLQQTSPLCKVLCPLARHIIQSRLLLSFNRRLIMQRFKMLFSIILSASATYVFLALSQSNAHRSSE